ncbi:unnamed protein product [Ilex paraguariensis]|uniref:PWWP domain-containing protein n=1 Tax=Ilex paraguariensis TaxID=185542 RepID=A0ABC8R200_9AQUA
MCSSGWNVSTYRKRESSLFEKCTGLVLYPEGLGGENGGEVSDIKELGNVEVTNSYIFREVQKEPLVDASVAEGTPMEGGSLESDSEVKRLVVLHCNEMETSNVSVPEVGLEISSSEKVGVAHVVTDKDVEEIIVSQLYGIDSAKKTEVSGSLNGIFEGDDAVPVRDQVFKGGTSDQENEHKESWQLLPGNGENTIGKSSEVHQGVLEVTKDSPVDVEAKEVDGVEGGDSGDQEYKFCVGDLVWVKTRTQSWWPGLIYDPSSASKDVTKSDQRNCLLVKYFGNGSFVWCSASQFKPFLEYFGQMSRQSDSRSFLGAVQKAVGVIGKRVKMEMTCSCFLKECQTKLATLLAAGTKKGDSVSEITMGELGEFSVTRFEPTTFLAFIKSLAQDVSMPGMIDFTVIQNHLSAFYRSIGHCQLPMQQLRPTADAKDCVRDGLPSEKKDENLTKFSRGDRDVTLQKCGSGVAEEIISSDTPTESRKRELNVGDEAEDLDGCKVASCEVEITSPLMSPKKIEGRVYSIGNVDGGTRGRSDKGYESRERKRSKYLSPPFVDMSWGLKSSPTSGAYKKEDPMVEFTGKKSGQKWSRKPIRVHNVSNKPVETNASSAEFLFELHRTALDCLYPNESTNFDAVERFFSGFRSFSFYDELNNEMARVQALGQQESNHVLPTLPKVFLMEKGIGMEEGDVDLNRNNTSLLVEGGQITGPVASQGKIQPKKRKRSKGAALEITKTKRSKVAPFLKDIEVVGVYSLQCISELNGREKMNDTASLCQNTILTVAQPDVNGNNAEPRSLVKDLPQMGLPSPGRKPNSNKRKRKDKAFDSLKTKVASVIPDLNGNVTEPSSTGKDLADTNFVSPDGKPQRKRRRRNKAAAGMLDRREALGTALLLNFAPEAPLPSKEDLVATFGRFGPLKESETSALSDCSVQVVFSRSANAADAFQSLEKSSPFGPALLSYRLHHISTAAITQTLQPTDRLKTPAKPSGLKSHKGEAPDLLSIRQNLEMMTSMLEQAGDNLSAEMRAKLESQIKGLLKKVSTMVGSSSSA